MGHIGERMTDELAQAPPHHLGHLDLRKAHGAGAVENSESDAVTGRGSFPIVVGRLGDVDELFGNASVLGGTPHHGKPDRPDQFGRPNRSLHQIVLRTFLQRLDREDIVVMGREDNDGNAGSCRQYGLHGFDPVRVGKNEVEQHTVGAALIQVLQRRIEPPGLGQVVEAGPDLVEHGTDEADMQRVVFDEEDMRRGFHARGRLVTHAATSRSFALRRCVRGCFGRFSRPLEGCPVPLRSYRSSVAGVVIAL